MDECRRVASLGTHELLSDDDLASGGNSHCFGASVVTSKYGGNGDLGYDSLVLVPVMAYNPISNFQSQRNCISVSVLHLCSSHTLFIKDD